MSFSTKNRIAFPQKCIFQLTFLQPVIKDVKINKPALIRLVFFTSFLATLLLTTNGRGGNRRSIAVCWCLTRSTCLARALLAFGSVHSFLVCIRFLTNYSRNGTNWGDTAAQYPQDNFTVTRHVVAMCTWVAASELVSNKANRTPCKADTIDDVCWGLFWSDYS